MVEKSVATVAHLFFEAIFIYWGGEGTREGISLSGSIDFHFCPYYF